MFDSYAYKKKKTGMNSVAANNQKKKLFVVSLHVINIHIYIYIYIYIYGFFLIYIIVFIYSLSALFFTNRNGQPH